MTDVEDLVEDLSACAFKRERTDGDNMAGGKRQRIQRESADNKVEVKGEDARSKLVKGEVPRLSERKQGPRRQQKRL